ncbi:tRNA (N6-isopentenyl adenosine(37)-C2)-methylthiotransferase MiaB [Fumia xinanensis]|nr:tRNA (N6-isopentenyl adenosine(37)-C2)-methylthiotransferase MiaB [Fumia xinanensis]
MSEKKRAVLCQEEYSRQAEFMKKCAELVLRRYGDHRSPMALVRSYGCQQNVNDGEKIMGMLSEMGFGFTDDVNAADVILYNTCAVRENAEKKVFGFVGELSHCKARNENLLVGLCGCMAQQEHISAKIKKSYPQVDFVFGTHALYRFPEIFCKALTEHQRIFDIENSDGIIAEGIPVRRLGKIQASLPIMYGCNNFCTYCVVPLVRGRERSRSSKDVLQEAREIVAAGYREIMLLGQNVNSYGKDLDNDLSFPELLRAVNDIPGDFRIRFMTSHPKDCTKELIDAVAECNKICNHIHLPVQSGSDRILKLMNRHYTTEEYFSLIDYAREKIPDVMFSSDIIVGFPGETHEDFLETINLVQKVRYASLFTFIYSKRVGTKAASMEDPVSASEKSKWFQELLDVQRKITDELYRDCVGRTYRVLVERTGDHDDYLLAGRTENNIIIDFEGDPSLVGEFAMVEIVSANNRSVRGKLVNE